MKYQPTERKADINESMVPYFGSYGAGIKQAMHQKPDRFCCKVCCLKYLSGYLLTFDVHQGSKGQNTGYKDIFGVSAEKVFSLIGHFLGNGPLHLFLDNFFVSVLLFKELSKKKIFVKGTFRKDRVGDCPLSVMKSTNRDEHQAYNAVDNGEITIGF